MENLFWPDLQAIARVHPKTIQNWRTGRVPLRGPALTLAELVARDAILTGDFDGWRCVHGLLVSPDGETFTTGDIRASHWYRTLALSRPLLTNGPAHAARAAPPRCASSV